MKAHRHTGIDSPKIDSSNIDGFITDSEVMHTVNTETIAGIKTFTSIPVLPASDPTADNEMARKDYVDSLTPASTIDVSDTNLIDSADDSGSISQFQSIYTTVKQITFNAVDGNIRIKFDLKDDNGAGGCFGRIYINDVAVGTEQEETGGGWVTYSEDFTMETGDVVKLRVKYDNSGGGVGGQYRNLRQYYIRALDITAGTVILN